VIAAVRRPGLGVLASQETHRPNPLVATTLIVRHGHAKARSLREQVAKHRGLQHRATATIGQTIPTTTDALTSSRSERSVIRRPITTTAALLSRHALTILRPHVRTQSRGPIPLQAAATRLRRGPTPRRHRHTPTPPLRRRALTPLLATLVAAVEVAIVEGVAAAAPRPVGVEARTAAVVALLLTAGHRILCNQRARPDLPAGLFILDRKSRRAFFHFCRPFQNLSFSFFPSNPGLSFSFECRVLHSESPFPKLFALLSVRQSDTLPLRRFLFRHPERA
jgi:hypothetical protein